MAVKHIILHHNVCRIRPLDDLLGDHQICASKPPSDPSNTKSNPNAEIRRLERNSFPKVLCRREKIIGKKLRDIYIVLLGEKKYWESYSFFQDLGEIYHAEFQVAHHPNAFLKPRLFEKPVNHL